METIPEKRELPIVTSAGKSWLTLRVLPGSTTASGAVETPRVSEIVSTSNGTVLVNMTQYEGDRDPHRLLELALADAGEVFIGVSLNLLEVEDVLERLADGTAEAAAYVLGARIRDRRTEGEQR